MCIRDRGISVSRVGGNAQVKAMKKVAGTLKIGQAQYRELEALTKFSADMDPVTALTIDKRQKNTRLAHAAHIQAHTLEGVDQAQHIQIVGDAVVAADLVADDVLDVYKRQH